MEGLTISLLTEIWLGAFLKYWPLITGAVGTLVFTFRYLTKKAVQAEKSNDLLSEILESSVSMDKTVKDMLDKMSDMNLEVKLLKDKHYALADGHRKLEEKVEQIDRRKK